MKPNPSMMHIRLLAVILAAAPTHGFACCAVSAGGNHVVNADQTVLMIWDKERQTQHFIRKADFRTDASDIGFLVPSPSRPELEETGNGAFAELAKITAPREGYGGGFPLGCSAAPPRSLAAGVTVIEEKRVAGFDATVLTARSGNDLVKWLKDNGYAYSPAVAKWTKPYLGDDWHFTALKVAKVRHDHAKDVKAAPLRISFKTDKPLFPYREPDSMASARSLNAKNRLLRIYFIAETQYEGKIRGSGTWGGRTKWSGDITRHRKALLGMLRLPETTGPEKWWLTEIEDQWRYENAAGDVYFSPVANQDAIDRGIARHEQGDGSALVMLTGLLWIVRPRKRK